MQKLSPSSPNPFSPGRRGIKSLAPPGEGKLNLLLPSPTGRGVGGEGENLATKRVSR
ncbi:hypothetical protein FDUTEX481_05080 [Tolypothrix sp. PCC 7601]|nr:hypothetical protein FDUTEX481_05080 [Tolypothrix sp. PCC 7601]